MLSPSRGHTGGGSHRGACQPPHTEPPLSLDAHIFFVSLQVLAGADRVDVLVVDNAGADEPILVAEALADLSDGGLRVDTLVTVIGVSTFLAEWAAADLLIERGMEQDEDDPRTVTELLASQVRPALSEAPYG